MIVIALITAFFVWYRNPFGLFGKKSYKPQRFIGKR